MLYIGDAVSFITDFLAIVLTSDVGKIMRLTLLVLGALQPLDLPSPVQSMYVDVL